jgi:hypothetical protein
MLMSSLAPVASLRSLSLFRRAEAEAPTKNDELARCRLIFQDQILALCRGEASKKQPYWADCQAQRPHREAHERVNVGRAGSSMLKPLRLA